MVWFGFKPSSGCKGECESEEPRFPCRSTGVWRCDSHPIKLSMKYFFWQSDGSNWPSFNHPVPTTPTNLHSKQKPSQPLAPAGLISWNPLLKAALQRSQVWTTHSPVGKFQSQRGSEKMQVPGYISTMHQTGHNYSETTEDGIGLSRSSPLVNRCCDFPPAFPGPQPALGLERPKKCKGKWRTDHHEYQLTRKAPGHSHTEVLRGMGQRGPRCQLLVALAGTELPTRPQSSSHTLPRSLTPGS